VTLAAKKLPKTGRSIRPPHLRPQPRATPLQVSSLLLDAGLHPCLLLPILAKTRALFRWQIHPAPASTPASSFPDRIWPRLVRLPIPVADPPDAGLHPRLLLPKPHLAETRATSYSGGRSARRRPPPHLLLLGLDLARPSTLARRRRRPPIPDAGLEPLLKLCPL
jgi:hypothetical protein